MINHNEWTRINDIILIMNSTTEFEKMQRYFLEAIWLLIPYDKAMFYMIEKRKDKATLTNPVFVNIEPDFVEKYEMLYKMEPNNRLAGSAGKTMAYRDSELMEGLIKDNEELYRNSLIPKEMRYGGGIILAEDGESIAEITFFRGAEKGDFSAKELFIMETLSHHLSIRVSNRSAIGKSDGRYERMLKSYILAEKGMTRREIEIAMLIAAGKDNLQICDELSISLNTVKKHITSIYTKTGVKNRVEFISVYASL